MDPATPAAVAKQELRRRMTAALAELDPAAARRAAARVADRVLGLPEVDSATDVLVCLSFGHELDTWDLVERLLRSGRRVYAPRAAPGDAPLTVHALPCPLETLSFGLRQPSAACPAVPPETLDAALVAGLAFDRRGYRLGYGKGHFDRFLAGRDFPSFGLGHGVQLVDRLPVEPHDVCLAAVVTDLELCRAGGEDARS